MQQRVGIGCSYIRIEIEIKIFVEQTARFDRAVAVVRKVDHGMAWNTHPGDNGRAAFRCPLASARNDRERGFGPLEAAMTEEVNEGIEPLA